MARSIHLEIVTPEGLQLSEDVSELTAPSVQGEFGVLPRHRPLLAGLKTGIVRFTVDGDVRSVAIGPGFAKIADDIVNVLTDKFIAKDDVDAVIARKELKEAQAKVAKLTTESSTDERSTAISAARWAAVRLELYGDPPPATLMIGQETSLLGHEDYASTLLAAHAEHRGSRLEDEADT